MSRVMSIDRYDAAPDGSEGGPGWYLTDFNVRTFELTILAGPFETEQEAEVIATGNRQ